MISSIFPDDSPGYPKSDVLYRLAKEADGPIVEVGGSRGMGTIALAFGAQDGHDWPVYVIDPFLPVQGWAGEKYAPYLKHVWFENVWAAGVLEQVQLVMLPVQHLTWPYLVSLTFWDLGQTLDYPIGDYLDNWVYHVMASDALLAINETGGHDLGVDAWIAEHSVGRSALECVGMGGDRAPHEIIKNYLSLSKLGHANFERLELNEVVREFAEEAEEMAGRRHVASTCVSAAARPASGATVT